MERLTHQGEHGPYWDKAVFDKHGGMEEDLIIDRLAYYEDMEEQGRLVVLPCKVGETVYRIVDRGYLKDTCETDCYSCDILCPYEGREYERVIEIVPWEMVSIGAIVNAMEQLGKTVFLTREKAEQALKGGASQ